MEAEGEVGGRGNETQGTKGNLYQRIDQRVQRRFGGSFDSRICEWRAVCGKDAGPEVKGVSILPVIDGLIRFFCGMRNTGAEMDG